MSAIHFHCTSSLFRRLNSNFYDYYEPDSSAAHNIPLWVGIAESAAMHARV